MRICKGCGPTTADFPKGRNYCQPCYKAKKRAWRQKQLAAGGCTGCYRLVETQPNGYCERCIANRTKNTERLRKLSAWVTSLKDGRVCTDCGQSFEPSLMHWDHLPGFDKIDNVSDMVWRGFRRETILKEIAKCELVCAACHVKRGIDRGQTTPYGGPGDS